ncbi:MAG TPA: aquaporin [Ktedonobacteraceae bacterium]|nr:aquaporin [Ktedonobacteraceae bacterium]
MSHVFPHHGNGKSACRFKSSPEAEYLIGNGGNTMTLIMLRRYLAEFIGTFAYVFFGCGTRILVGGGQDAASRLLVYFTFGFALLALTYALGHFSGAPFNPATTFGFAVARRFPWRYLLPYWFFQVSGALTASTVLLRYM